MSPRDPAPPTGSLPPDPPPRPAPLGPGRALIFALIPILVMALALEGLLRAREVLGPDPLIGPRADAPGLVGPRLLKEGPHLIQGLNDVRFPADKPPGALRIFTFGGSSTYGFPYQPHASFARFLQARIQLAQPSRAVEVVNLGFVSADSFTVARLAHESLDYDPDVLVIYAGHNEYLRLEFAQYDHYRQAPHRAATQGAGDLLLAALERSHLFRWGRFLVTDVRQVRLAKAAAAEGRAPPSLYDRRDGPLSPARQEALAQSFEHRLRGVIEAANAEGVRVILASPLADYRSFAPRGLKPAPTGAAGDGGEGVETPSGAEERIASLITAVRFKEAMAALDAAREALAPGRGAWLRGRILEGLGQPREAAQAYLDANDADPYPHRIQTWGRRALAALGSTTPALYAPVWERLGDPSLGGLPPKALTVDHVHPSLPGQDAIARVLLDTLIGAGVVTPDPAALPPPTTAALMAQLNLTTDWEWVWNQRLAHYLAHSGDRIPAHALLVETLQRCEAGAPESPLLDAYAESLLLGALGETGAQAAHDAACALAYGAAWDALRQRLPPLSAEGDTASEAGGDGVHP